VSPLPTTPRPLPGNRDYTSFDRGYRAQTGCFIPDRYSFWDSGPSASPPPISRGAGLSYAAASFAHAGATVEHRFFNRLLDFDSSTHVLEVESGVTLGQVYDFAIGHNLYLPVQPGHPNITVGGCIAPDVHGKNAFRDGTFLSQIESLRLFHPQHGILELNRSQHPDLFRLTCGGFGLTGNILSARLRLARAGHAIELRVLPCDDIRAMPVALADAAAAADLVYTWHDFTALATNFGRGFLVTGSFVETNGPDDDGRLQSRARKAIDSSPLHHIPFSLWNRWTAPPFNLLYGELSRRWGTRKQISIYEFLFPVANKALYFHLFGRVGFHECQLLIPATGFSHFLEQLRGYLKRRRLPIALASGKLFRGPRELLRFAGDGICLALDFPRTAEGRAFAEFLDRTMLESGGWPNLIKDSRLSADVVAAAYPEYDRFRRQLREFDPLRSYRSELSERLAL
jgi:decaprenylphospho-beta-D-ribofuranose 2-oxidase